MIALVYRGGSRFAATFDRFRLNMDVTTRADGDTFRVLCPSPPDQSMKSDLDNWFRNRGWQFIRTEDPARKPRNLDAVVTDLDAQLDTSAKLRTAILRLLATFVQGKRAGEHGMGPVDGTEEA